ncbi:threonine/homoserine/homoserine lactone efflux protein [Geobacter argillaceus]|uniref:Threonine/homoserine/homoserine lactone efflux protein n=1 Tax=Geobacter argillaceus TaxID=345631 RepID=A0A562VLE9_9BACT|nr:threonine/homoserine/homoserine lactone efflux protein [Geobacter argillaceus]
MIHFLSIGIILGLSAGFSPGPLLMLVISETLRHGTRSGIKVALAPIITDLPIILVTLACLVQLSGYHDILGIISLAGGMFVLFTGYEALRTQEVELILPKELPRSLLKGVLTNILSPHPYLFWISVGAPILTRSLTISIAAFSAFIAGFYLSLVGAKIILAIAVGRSKLFLSSRLYLYIMRFLGFLLTLLAVMLLREGVKLLGFI